MPFYRNKLFFKFKLTDNIIKHPISEQEQLAKNDNNYDGYHQSVSDNECLMSHFFLRLFAC